MMLCVIFFLSEGRVALSAEDTGQLVELGEAALARDDYEQARLTGIKILNQDPRNLIGYKFVLIHCVVIGSDVAFYKIIEMAKAQGVPELEMEKLVMQLLFVANHEAEVDTKLVEYEEKWYEAYERSH